RQRDDRVLVVGDVYAGDTRHVLAPFPTKRRQKRAPSLAADAPRFNRSITCRRMVARSPLPLLVARLGRADHAHDALAPHDLAVATELLHRRSHFHGDL